MKFGEINSFLTGVAVPVFSLKTEESCGVGEFLDLIMLGEWCKKTSLDIIQILPVNDTGNEPSPYNAQSAFALNPLFIRLQALEGAKTINKKLAGIKAQFNKEPQVNYQEILDAKLDMLRSIFSVVKNKVRRRSKFTSWVKNNENWLKTYCVFCVLKDYNEKRSWKEWEVLRDPASADIEKYWKNHKEETLFYAWIQYNLEIQFKTAVDSLDEMGVKLKGDIPILINEDSADVWGNRSFFDLTMRAGAPPDMFSEKGQNWGFPCYNWEELEKNDYMWWRDRLRQASKFYHAYRIDHVLGFFRIWQIPEEEKSGLLGIFKPAVSIQRQTLLEAGLGHDTINALVSPEYTQDFLNDYLGAYTDELTARFFEKTSSGKLTFNSNVTGEKSFLAVDIDDILKEKLVKLYWNRVLVTSSDGSDTFLPSWYFYKTAAFNNLPDHERGALQGIIDGNWSAQDELWRKNGKMLLQMMLETTDMLVCAEDLGAVPPCVPEVLTELGILGLRIERWTREYDKEPAPFIDPADYQRYTVCSPSGHDTSTLRQWWAEENNDKHLYYPLLHMSGEYSDDFPTELAERIIKRNLNANSLLCIFPVYDFLALYYNLRTEKPEDERINIPGTITPKNWSYRMKDTLEFLNQYTEYNNYLKGVLEERRRRPL